MTVRHGLESIGDAELSRGFWTRIAVGGFFFRGMANVEQVSLNSHLSERYALTFISNLVDKLTTGVSLVDVS